jgi:hypothetical protein
MMMDVNESSPPPSNEDREREKISACQGYIMRK